MRLQLHAEWLFFFESTYEQKGGAPKANRWISTLLHTLATHAQEPIPLKAESRGGGAGKMDAQTAEELSELFNLVAAQMGDGGTISKEELVKAQNGDFKVSR